MCKDIDVEVQGSWCSSILPKSGSLDLGMDKEPLIWEMITLSQHCDPEVSQLASQVIGVSSKKKHVDQLKFPQNVSKTAVPDTDENDKRGFVILSI